MSDLKEKNQTFRVLALCFFLALLSILGADRWLSNQVFSLQKKDAELQDKITRLALDVHAASTQHKKEQALADREVEIAAYQKHTEQFLQGLSKGQQKSVCFSHLSRHKSQLEWQGYALSSSHLFAYLNEVVKSNAWQSVTLDNLQQEVLQEKVKFKVSLKERTPLSLNDGVESAS